MCCKESSILTVVIFFFMIQLPVVATAVDEYQTRIQDLLVRMAKLCPHGSMDPKLSESDDQAALEKAKGGLSQVDYLLEDVDDAYTVGDFTRADALLMSIQKTTNLSQEQSSRMEGYLLALNQERSARKVEQEGRAATPVVKNFPRDVLRKHDPWSDVLTFGGIVVGLTAVGVGAYLLTK